MKPTKIISLLAAIAAMSALSACGPNVEKCAIPAVERAFRAEGKIVKCSKVSNICSIDDSPYFYKARALVKHNGVHSYYTVLIEVIDSDAIVKIDKSSRADIN